MAQPLLVLRPGAIGDTLVTAPALMALRHRFGDSPIHAVGNAAALPILVAMGLVDAWTGFDHPSVTGLFMPGEPPSDDRFSPIGGAVAWGSDPDGVLEGALRRRGAEYVLVAQSRPPDGSPTHIARHLLQTLAPLGIADEPSLLPSIEIPPEAESAATEALAEAGLASGEFVVVHPGSGSPRKNWPAERFGALLRRLDTETTLTPILLTGPADDDAVARVLAGLPRPVPVLLGFSLLVVAAVMARARAYLGNDSGPSHLAGMLGIPTLALFGPTDPAVWSPLGPGVQTLRHQPLADLDVETTWTQLRAMLDR